MDSKTMFQNVCANTCASFWLKTAMLALSKRDALDALRDADLLLKYAKMRELEAGRGIY